MPLGLHLNYEEDFLKYWHPQVSRVFSDPQFLPSMANSVYDLATPPVLSKVPPFSAAPEKSTSPDEFLGGQDDTSTPKTSLPTTPTRIIDDSDTESNGTIDLGPEQSQSTQESPFRFS